MQYKKMFSRLKNQSGAVLINFLVGLAIIAMIITISIPNFRKFEPNMQLNSAANELSADLRYAQQKTLTEQIPYGVSFDVIGNGYSILMLDGVSTTTIKSIVLPASVTLQSATGFTDNLVVFNSYGAVRESGTITMNNTNSKIKTIDVKPSGYIELSQ